MKADGGCIVWTGAKDRCGYGLVFYEGRCRKAHRLLWTLANGEVPAGMELDHLCRNRACVDWDHMEPVSHRENVLRGFNPAALQARRPHCVHGHPFDEGNTYRTPQGRRQCRICTRQRGAEYQRVRRAKEKAA